jgi:2-polyprenyl-6-methoxyphenol hydroxylase-like FAD-dependent oxidoreductase
MHELGLLDRLLQLPHQKVPRFSIRLGNRDVTIADLSRLPVRCGFLALMPQWDFLNFLAAEAKRYPSFSLHMNSEVTDAAQLEADLVVAADGRHSTLRAAAKLPSEEFGAPMDVLWFRLSHRESDPSATQAVFGPGRLMVMLNRGDYWQCAYVINKGAADEVRRHGLPWLRDGIVRIQSWLGDRVGEIDDWEKVKLLTVRVDRLQRWWNPGLLCIGDAAHAMSPIGGVGINLAIQDAVAAANVLAVPLREGKLTLEHLAAVQRRRDWPTRMTQRFQLMIQKQLIARVLAAEEDFKPPPFVRLLAALPTLSHIPARIIGLGFRPEHVRQEIRGSSPI